MKRNLFLGLSLIALLASCVKKKESPVGDAHVRFVNAASGISTQDIYIDKVAASTGTFSDGAQTAYFTYTAGINLISFANSTSGVETLSYTYGSEIGDYATIYLFHDFSGVTVSGGIKDNMTAPATGKARVRFLNLHNFLQTSFTMAKADGTSLFTSLEFSTTSPYYDVDPGTKFVATAIGITTPISIDFNPVAGKIYTVWIGGTSTTDFQSHPILQNY